MKKTGKIKKQLIIMAFMLFIIQYMVFTAEQCFLVALMSGRIVSEIPGFAGCENAICCINGIKLEKSVF